MKKNELRDQDKDKINKINQNQIMNLLIVRTINYENKNKNKNKKFNNVLKIEIFENKNEFKFHNKNKNKNETKLKKLNEISMSNNAEKKNSYTLIVIIMKNNIHNYAFINILNLQRKNDEKTIKLK